MSFMLDMALPALFVIVIWWASTGLVFALNGLSERTYATSLVVVAILALAALGFVWATASATGRFDAAWSLMAAITVWAAIEMSFLMGLVTGPRRTGCPTGCSEWQRFGAAFLAMAYHEVALVAALAALWWATLDAPNTVAVTTFGLLWLMRLSTKLNIFLGVPNPAADLLPPRIAFLKSYFRQAPMSFLFPVSVTLATLVTGYLAMRAWAAQPGSFEAQSMTMLAALAALGWLEHWFLVLPVRAETLWGWSLAGRRDAERQDPERRDPLLPRMQPQT